MEFLTEKNQEKWKKILNDMKKVPKVTQIYQLVTTSGFVEF